MGLVCFSFPVHCVQCDEYFMVSDRDEHCIKVFSGEGGNFSLNLARGGKGMESLMVPVLCW